MWPRLCIVVALFFVLAVLSGFALGYANLPDPPDTSDPSFVSPLNTGDTAWMLTSSALVMLMSFPGLAVFYGGLAKPKDTLNTIAMTCATYCIVSVLWILYGYTLAFGPDHAGIIGDLSKIFLRTVGPYSTTALAPTIPEYIYIMFQMTTAAITVALASGGYVERIKFSSWMLFSALWLTIVYLPISHWVWANGFLMTWGVLDFAGGTVVHINSGVAALVGSIILGRRQNTHQSPGNLTLVVLGTGLLWFGWFGFNAGCAVGASGVAAAAFINTNTACATGALTWMLAQYNHEGKFTISGLCFGAISGLVCSTPASGFVNVAGSFFLGLAAGIFSYFFITLLKPKLGFDDALDAFGVHAISGSMGVMLTGVFADPKVNSRGGLIYNHPAQLSKQLLGICITALYSGVMTALIFLFIKYTIGIRVNVEEEEVGMDASQHGEKAYSSVDTSNSPR